jgi:hypothetical protein
VLRRSDHLKFTKSVIASYKVAIPDYSEQLCMSGIATPLIEAARNDVVASYQRNQKISLNQ